MDVETDSLPRQGGPEHPDHRMWIVRPDTEILPDDRHPGDLVAPKVDTGYSIIIPDIDLPEVGDQGVEVGEGGGHVVVSLHQPHREQGVPELAGL